MIKKIPRKFILVALISVVIAYFPFGITSAWFMDKAKAEVTAQFATIQVHVTKVAISDNTYTFTIVNGSNIPTYMRVGLIPELKDSNGAYLTDDVSQITYTASGNWSVETRAFDASQNYKKVFAKYFDISENDYALISAGDTVTLSVEVGNVPSGYQLDLTAVPEMIQGTKKALDYVKNVSVEPSW